MHGADVDRAARSAHPGPSGRVIPPRRDAPDQCIRVTQGGTRVMPPASSVGSRRVRSLLRTSRSGAGTGCPPAYGFITPIGTIQGLHERERPMRGRSADRDVKLRTSTAPEVTATGKIRLTKAAQRCPLDRVQLSQVRPRVRSSCRRSWPCAGRDDRAGALCPLALDSCSAGACLDSHQPTPRAVKADLVLELVAA